MRIEGAEEGEGSERSRDRDKKKIKLMPRKMLITCTLYMQGYQ